MTSRPKQANPNLCAQGGSDPGATPYLHIPLDPHQLNRSSSFPGPHSRTQETSLPRFGNPHLIHLAIQEGRLRRQMKPVPDNPQLLFSICRFEVGILPTIRTMGVDQYYLTNERAKEKKVQGFLCVSDGGAVQAIACVFVVVC